MDRFTIRRTIGAGGMGVVYEAHDRERDTIVALKTIREMSGASLYRFKGEFRALADIAHPNLVTLYEFVATEDDCFFTMELVDGVSFLEYVRPGFHPRRPGDPSSSHAADEIETLPLLGTGDGEPTADSDPEQVSAACGEPPEDARGSHRLQGVPLDETRLRSALAQLAAGVFALHQAGKLHRDIKPSNVLVSNEGRVALCDFGIATELRREQADVTREFDVVGTAAYMSPQQAANVRLTEASDWYSVGVLLYEALTARRPFEGRPRAVLRAKQLREPLPPHHLVDNLPSDLASLCFDLIQRYPTDRPSGREVLRRLKVEPPQGYPASQSGSIWDNKLVGREPHLRQLADAFAVAKQRKASGQRSDSVEQKPSAAVEQQRSAAVAFVHGSSGMGKTLLLRRFFEQINDDEVVLLSGRCYVSESVPFKALDSVVDSLSTWLTKLWRPVADQLMPADVHALARLFPVLRRVEAVVEFPRRRMDAPDPQEIRRRAFAALRQLLWRVAERFTLIVCIDDMQWGDADSGALLIELLRPPDPPPFLLVCSYRTEDAEHSPLVQILSTLAAEGRLAAEVREVSVDRLSHPEACELVLTLLQRNDERAWLLADRVARESGGSPFFVDELVRHVNLSRELGAPVTLDDALRKRVAQLPEAPRALLTALCVAGGPVRQEVAGLAMEQDDLQQQAMTRLRAERMVRARGIRPEDPVEVFHDRIREAVVASLPDRELRRNHHRLAVALERAAIQDPVPLMQHWLGAGEAARAGRYAAEAAEQALASLAFERAARLFLTASELQTLTQDEALQLRVKRAEALASAGRGAEAASVFVEAAEGANMADGLKYRGRAAEELLRSGFIEEGMVALREVADAVGMKLPETPRRALASLFLARLRIRLRGLWYRERDVSQVSAAELRRIDVCASAAIGLGMVNNIFGATLQSRSLLLALRAGEPYRLSRAVATEAVHTSTSGSERRVARLLALSKKLAVKTDDKRALGMQQGAAGLTAYQLGRFRAALDSAEEATATFQDHCAGVTVELNTTRVLALWSLFYLGELRELAHRVPVLLAEAEDRGDRFAIANLCTGIPNIAWLLADDVRGAVEVRRRAMKDWPTKYGYHLQHYSDLSARQHVALYEGEGERAWQELDQEWPALSRSMLLRIKMMGVMGLYMRARCAVAAAHAGHDRSRLLRLARRDTRRIERRGLPCAPPIAQMIRAAAAGTKRRSEAAAALLASAEQGFRAAGMLLFAHTCARIRGKLIGGDEGRELRQSADTYLAEQKVADPSRLIAMLAPGFEG